MNRESICHFLGWIHIVYLGLLPALATFAVLFAFGSAYIFLVFLGGVITVSVYLAVVTSYTPYPSSVTAGILLLIDGPVFAILSQLRGGDSISIVINSFIVDGAAVWLAIVWLASTSSRPSGEQRMATQMFALVAAAAMMLIFWPYLKNNLVEDWMKGVWLVAGIIEGVAARHFLLKTEKVVRKEGISSVFLGVCLFIWIAAMSAGNVLHQMFDK